MGYGGRMTSHDWDDYSTTHIDGNAADKIYTSTKMDPTLDPKNVAMRESCDSPESPESTAVIAALDVTGSMGNVLEATAKGLGVMVDELYKRRPVTDPQLMFMGVGDAEAGDQFPLQVSQFEADIRIAEQLTKIFFEHRGGGNSYESYILAWYFAALHTKIDCFEKRGKKGILFTMGDELPTPYLRPEDVSRVLGTTPQVQYTAKQVLEMVTRQYHVFHLIIEEGNYYMYHGGQVIKEWTELLGQHAIPVSDCTKIAEVMVSVMQAVAGEDKDKIISSWDGDTSLVVSKAIGGLEKIDGALVSNGHVEF